MGTVPPALPLLLLAQPAEDPVASDPEVSRLGATPDRDRIRESAYPEEFGVPGHCRMPAALPRGADESADNMSGPGYDCHGRPVLDRARAHCGDGGHSRARAPRTPPAPPLAHPQDAAATAIGSYCSASVHLRDLRRPSCSSSSTRNRSGRQGGQSTAPSCRSRRPRGASDSAGPTSAHRRFARRGVGIVPSIRFPPSCMMEPHFKRPFRRAERDRQW